MKSNFKFDTLRDWLSRLAAGGMMLLAMAAAQGQPIAGQGTWETTLFARDINGDSVVDAYYDSVQNITWLADANAGAGSVFDDGYAADDGRMTWSNANAWAQGLDVHGVTGWRLPQFVVAGSSELSRMYFDTLGNAPFPPTSASDPPPGWTNTALFSNLTSWYWLSDAGSSPGQHRVWVVDYISTYHSQEPDTSNYRGWAVRDGDVPVVAVPEPETYVLMLLGLAALWITRRRRTGG